MYIVGTSEQDVRILNENSVQDRDNQNNFIIDVNYDPDDQGEWEDMLPPNLQEDEAFVHALRDLHIDP